jgi:dynamin 1-like protein
LDTAHYQANGDQPLNLTPKEEMETTLIRSLIGSYFGITRQTIQDLVPKAIMHLLVSSALIGATWYVSDLKVNFSRDAIQQRLVTSLYKPDLFAELLFEDEALVTERTRVKALLDAYKEAFKVLSETSLKSTWGYEAAMTAWSRRTWWSVQQAITYMHLNDLVLGAVKVASQI